MPYSDLMHVLYALMNNTMAMRLQDKSEEDVLYGKKAHTLDFPTECADNKGYFSNITSLIKCIYSMQMELLHGLSFNADNKGKGSFLPILLNCHLS